MTRLRYAPDEDPKRKHGWARACAGFVDVRGRPVGKCPKGFSLEDAEAILNDGIRVEGRSRPKVYAVHEGVLYRAIESGVGSYHGFPEHPSGFRKLPRRLQRQIWQRAEDRGEKRELQKWLSKWSSPRRR